MEVKASFSEDRTHLGKTLPIISPLHIGIDASEVCNIKCSYCFRSKDHKEYGYALKNDIMSMNTFYSVIEQLKEMEYNPKTLLLSGGGEPLCNPNLLDMIKVCKENFTSKVEFISNGILLNEKLALSLAKSEIDSIRISLQGLTAEKYKEVCGKAIDMDKFISNLKVLYDNSINTKIYVKIADIALESNEEDKFYKMFKDCCHYANIEKILDIWSDVDFEVKKEHIEENRHKVKIDYQNCCSQSFYTLIINPSGDVYPCCNPLFNIPLGNVKDKSLKQIWNSNVRLNFLKNQLTNGRKNIACCKNCNAAQFSIMDNEYDSLNGYEEVILKRMEK